MKIICVGRNYDDHAKELGNKVMTEPVIFLKPKTALAKSSNKLYHPFHTIDWQHEAEIVVRISKNGKSITPNEAPRFYNQYTIGLDMTARDVQERLKKQGLPWDMAKATDNSAAIGEFRDITDHQALQNIDFELAKNNKIVQEGNTSSMIFSINQIVSYISQYFMLNIGDLIFTGTPSGVGHVEPGDLLEGYVAGEQLLTAVIV